MELYFSTKHRRYKQHILPSFCRKYIKLSAILVLNGLIYLSLESGCTKDGPVLKLRAADPENRTYYKMPRNSGDNKTNNDGNTTNNYFIFVF